jgi:hypothetical protein
LFLHSELLIFILIHLNEKLLSFLVIFYRENVKWKLPCLSQNLKNFLWNKQNFKFFKLCFALK